MKCRICNTPIVVVPLKIVTLDKQKEIYYDVILDICDYCNGPIIGVRKHNRQDSSSLNDNKNEYKVLEDKLDFYTKSNDNNDGIS
jgi:hypothetical protein